MGDLKIEKDGQENITYRIKPGERTAILSKDAVEALEAIAKLRNISLGEALIQAITTERYLREATESGAKLFIKKNGRLSEMRYNL